MNVGQSIITLPTVKPKSYAGKVGTIAVVNEGEVGVLVNGRVVWFLEREIEECQNGLSSSVDAGKGAKSVKTPGGSSPLSQSIQRDAHTSSPTGQDGAGSGREDRGLPAPAATTDRSSSARARGQGATARGGAQPGSPERPTTIDSRGEEGARALPEPEPDSSPSRGSGEAQELTLGERGPRGGVVARCEACGELWERPKQRGRPARKCEACRNCA